MRARVLPTQSGLEAAWAAMCAPVRARYAAAGGPNRARDVVLGLLRREVGRRNRTAAAAPERLEVDARILVVQPDHLGGVLASTPAFSLIKAALPTAELTVLAGPWGADAAEHCPAVDRVRLCRFPAFDRSAGQAKGVGRLVARVEPYQRLFQMAAEMEKERYAAAVLLTGDFWSAALTALARVPLRLGLASEEGAPFMTHTFPTPVLQVGKERAERPEHGAVTHLRVAEEVVRLAGRDAPADFSAQMRYEPSAADRADAVRLWRAHDLDEASDVVAIHPAPGGAPKRWQSERFAMLADHLAGRFGARVVITGGPADVDEARAVASACRRSPVVLAGQSSFGALGALLERCRLAVGTDNGAMHLATARGVPTLRLFGPTDAAVWSGWTGRTEASEGSALTVSLESPRACSPCHRLDVPDWRSTGEPGSVYPCMGEIEVEAVIAAAERLWHATAGRAAR